jgi:hypothetical protein
MCATPGPFQTAPIQTTPSQTTPSHQKGPFRMPSRRSVLALTASLLGLPLAAGPAAAFAGLGAGSGSGALRPEVRRYGRFFLVNGWVLTADDLERLGLDAA